MPLAHFYLPNENQPDVDANPTLKILSTQLSSHSQKKQPDDPAIRVRLLRLYLETDRINEAYTYALEEEKRRPFPQSREWYACVLNILEVRNDESFYTDKYCCWFKICPIISNTQGLKVNFEYLLE